VVLTTYVNDLIGYAMERGLIRNAEPHRLKKLTLMWAGEAEAPDGVRMVLRELSAAAV
jgi:hypothetical protein